MYTKRRVAQYTLPLLSMPANALSRCHYLLAENFLISFAHFLLCASSFHSVFIICIYILLIISLLIFFFVFCFHFFAALRTWFVTWLWLFILIMPRARITQMSHIRFAPQPPCWFNFLVAVSPFGRIYENLWHFLRKVLLYILYIYYI